MAPDPRGSLGYEARRFAKERLLQSDVQFTVVRSDRHGGYVSNASALYGNGTSYDIALGLLADGWAEISFERGHVPSDLVVAENEARLENRGVWRDRTRYARRMVYGRTERVRVLDVLDATTMIIQFRGFEFDKVNQLLRGRLHPLPSKPRVGDLVVCGTPSPCRCRVREFRYGGTVGVDKIDTGESAHVRVGQLSIPPEELADFERLALRVKLAFIEPFSKTEDTTVVREYCRDVDMWVHLMYERDVPYVLLTKGQQIMSGSLNMYQLRQQLARFADVPGPLRKSVAPILKLFRQA
jgi:hypothetical protein